MKPTLSSLLVFLAFFALGSVAYVLAPVEARRPAATTQAKSSVEIKWGEGSEADLSRSEPASSR